MYMSDSSSLLVLMQVVASHNGVRSVDELRFLNQAMDDEELAVAVAELVDEGYVEFIDDGWIGATVDGGERLKELRLSDGLGMLYQLYDRVDFPFSIETRPDGFLDGFKFEYDGPL